MQRADESKISFECIGQWIQHLDRDLSRFCNIFSEKHTTQTPQHNTSQFPPTPLHCKSDAYTFNHCFAAVLSSTRGIRVFSCMYGYVYGGVAQRLDFIGWALILTLFSILVSVSVFASICFDLGLYVLCWVRRRPQRFLRVTRCLQIVSFLSISRYKMQCVANCAHLAGIRA